MIVEAASNPRWTSDEKTAVTLVVKFKHFPKPVPFTACKDDGHQHGVDLFNDVVAGKYGDILEPFPVEEPAHAV